MEEDIKFIKYYINEYIAVEDIGIEDDFKFQEVIEQLIKEYKELKGIEESHKKENGELREKVKQLEEENEDLKNLANNKQWISPCYVAQNYISKSKIKEKIEELDKEYIDILSDYGNIDTDVVINIPNENVRKYCEKLVEKIIVLQELLEKRK